MSTTTSATTPQGNGSPTIFSPTAPANAAGVANTTGDDLGENSFLQLLVTQLQNQDPTNPMDDTTWVSELAQFSSLQQMTNLNTTLTGQGSLSSMSEGASMIGKMVTSSTLDSNGNPISGVVTSVSVNSGTGDVSLNLGNQAGAPSVDVTTITGIQSAQAVTS